jgi:hypothetical protein
MAAPSSNPATQIQIIEKANPTKQHIVPLLQQPYKKKEKNTVLIRTKIISLTNNTLTYALGGGRGFPGLDWWNVWPFPSSSSSSSSGGGGGAPLPPPFDAEDAEERYCRIAAWGTSVVVESGIADLPVGTELFGYQPVGNGVECLCLEAVDGKRWTEVSERRVKGLLPIYNRYVAYPPSTSSSSSSSRGGGEDGSWEKESKGWDALMRPLYQSAFLLNRFAFDWTAAAERKVHPLGIAEIPWSEEEADIAGAVVVLLAASGKTGLATAYELRNTRPDDKKPAKVVGVGSEWSREFSRGTGLFDEVLLYEDVDSPGFDLAGILGGSEKKKVGKVVVVDFGARGAAVEKWVDALKEKAERFQVVAVGADPLSKGPSKIAALAMQPGSGVAQMNAGGLQEHAAKVLGAREYSAELDTAWEAFKANGAVPGLRLTWGRGIDEYGKGWEALVAGGGKPDVGLVYEL